MFDVSAVQKSLFEFGLDGWLLYDFRGSNVLARRVLGLPEKTGTRRFFYFIHKITLQKKDRRDVPAQIQNVIRQHTTPSQMSSSELEAETNA